MARSLLPSLPKLPKLPNALPKAAALPRPVGLLKLTGTMGSLGGMFGSARKGIK